MKKLIILLSICFVCLDAAAQLQGRFGYGNDGHVYFYLYNPTPYNIPIGYGPGNYETNESRSYVGVMPSQQIFAYGPNAGWVWKKGEVFLITYPNGQDETWTCPYDDPALSRRNNPSFGDSYCSKYRGKKCSEQGLYDAVPCNCPGFSCSNWDASRCSKCPHHATKHTR